MKPIEKDQLPKIIAVGVVATGVLGFAAYSWLGGSGSGTPAVAATNATTQAQPPEPVVGPKASIPALQLAEIYHQDPFKPAFGPETAPPPAPPKPAPAPAPARPPAEPKPTPVGAPGDSFNGPAMEALPAVVKVSEVTDAAAGRPAPPPAPKPEAARPAPAAKPAPPPAAPPPPVVITGILEGDDNVAILKWSDDHRQVVRVGDKLDGGYVVKAIRTDAVVVAHKNTTWTIRLGGDKPVAN
jgi:hypothetical protein